MSESEKIKAENIRWDLSVFYHGINDPQIEADIKAVEQMLKDFRPNYKGHLTTKLGAAITDYTEINMLTDKVFCFLCLLRSTDVNNEAVKTKIAKAEKVLNFAFGEYLSFFELEIARLEDKVVKQLYKTDKVVARHRPWVEQIRLHKPHLLSEEVEAALTKRAAFSSSAWADFFVSVEDDLRFNFQGKECAIEELLHILSEDSDAQVRAEALKAINDVLKGSFAKYSAQTLYMVTGEKEVEDRERKYPHPMTDRNKSNQIPDKVVEVLHEAVEKVAGPLTRNYYRLKAVHLGLPVLRWSDRNAKMPFIDKSVVPFDEALKIVIDAYQNFSPTLAKLVRQLVSERRIDAPNYRGKESGAFNDSVVLPGRQPVSFILLNYMGSNSDVMTLAHELGHAVHGLLAGESQGSLMVHAPIPYAETASIFGEMTTFNYLKKRLIERHDSKSLLALIMQKIDRIINSTVRQISLSNFERRIHGVKRRLSAEEFKAIWLEVTKAFYGQDGEIFTYENIDYLWSYIPHFHRPFYVYGYSFGELLTQSLYAQQDHFGERFEPLYLELLRAGNTKNVVELLKPFGLDPIDPQFWASGIKISIGEMVKEAEKLSRDMGINI